MTSNPEHALVVYGSLQPGEANHHVVADIHGEWIAGTVLGELGTWGPYLRFVPGGENAQPVRVQVLCSHELPQHWQRLDEFEGEAYERIVCEVETARGKLLGYIYAHPRDGKGSVRQDQYRGALLGLACGDAVGTTLEFQMPGTFDPIDDMVGGGPFNLRAGEWTDDTSMALCLAESLIERRGFDAKDQCERYYRWYDEGYLSSTGTLFDIGGTTQRALIAFKQSGDPYSGLTAQNSAGNGSIMRLAPVPLFFASDITRAIEMSAESSKTTHANPLCVDACRYLGALIAATVYGADKEELLSAQFAPPNLIGPIAQIAKGSFKTNQASEIKGSGYVVKSLEAALWAFYTTDDFRSGCLAAVNLGDDADTTAAVYGQLAGAFYGSEAIPLSWRQKLAMREKIIQYADQIWQLRL